MEAVLAAFLAPCLPYLVKVGEQVAGQATEKLGAAVWERASALWAKLRPKVEGKEAAREAAADVAADPGDRRARTALELQLEKLLAGSPALARELAGMLEEAKQAGVIAADGAVAIGGDVRADRGGVAAGRDVHVDRGGIHTGWREPGS